MERRISWSWLRDNWGFSIFVVDVVAALIAVTLRPIAGHYINYTEPAKYLWALKTPYEIVFPGSPGAFFYSPGCALFFYGAFAFLPARLGQFLYVVLCLGVFCIGFSRLFSVLEQRLGFVLKLSPYRHLFWLMVGSEALGSVIAVKIDLLIVGVVSLALVELSQRRARGAVFLLGLMTSWKLHPVALSGLLVVGLVVGEISFALWVAVVFGTGAALGFLSPLFVLPWDFAVDVTRHWMEALQRFVAAHWLDNIFQHVFGFYARTFHYRVDLGWANTFSAFVGLSLAAITAISARAWYRTKQLEEARLMTCLCAAGLGGGFTAAFSQLTQSNSYIVYVPLLVFFLVLTTRRGWGQLSVSVLLGACFFIISLAYSDLIPRPLYRVLFDAGIKPLGILLLGGAVVGGLKEEIGLTSRLEKVPSPA